ncbi:ABC transporter permease [Klebsiella variicola]|nr:ABC transporter permease [Klebsiella variicola]
MRHSDYVEAARGSGGTFFAVFWRHILPNSLTAVLAFATLQFGQAMLALATLSFLGYGTPAAGPGVGIIDRRRSQLPVDRLVADHLPRPRRGRRGPCRQSS